MEWYMGLIQRTVPVHNPNKVHTDGSSSSPVEEVKSFDMTIYRVLSSWDNMRVLEYPERIQNEFDIFLKKAEEHQAGIVDPDFVAMNEYLGTFTDESIVVPISTTREVVYNTTENVVDNGVNVIHVVGV